ncbi:extracellular solute-binding protein [Rhizobium laguerreae]|uniref:extracellular solute-binding protein n=1 Tax=Rhizobium laguerreae TaxID=1076926 RepID=UPI001C9137E4|nr:extracellular solute-binding protein [Rhizobium laguerreae]MBY3165679.1 extracellular solute-binding protein [Rhizobium laguerreae]
MKKPRNTVAIAIVSILAAPAAHAADNKLVMASWGGIFKDTTQKFIAAPFEKALNATVEIADVGGGWAAKIQAQKAAGNVQWDIIDSIDAGSAEYLYKNGMVAPLPADLAAKLKAVSIPGTVTEYGIEEGSTGVVIACRKEVKCPTTSAEFFDAKAFPGARAIVNEPNQVLPFAALAAGVPKDKLFPVDLDKAFALLNSIKSEVSVWPTSGDQQQQVLRSGEVDMAIMWNGRAYDLTQKGTPLTLVWNGALLDPGYIVVLKDAPNKDLAFKYLEYYATHAQQQADWAKVLPYGMASKDVAGLLPKEIADALPSSHDTVKIDPAWFAEHQAEIGKRWQEFLSAAQ